MSAALVVALGMAGEVDKAVEMVEDMEQRGVLECAGVYYALACTLCTAGRWPDALIQVRNTLSVFYGWLKFHWIGSLFILLVPSSALR